ncbi:MAG: IclR family transcriptional regulator [Hyphomicrobiales bacterium]
MQQQPLSLVPSRLPARTKRTIGRLPAAAEQPRGGFPTLKAVAILETIASARHPLSISELSVLLDLPKPTAHRIIRMLENEGLLQREPGARCFVPGERLVRLGFDILAASMLRAPRHAILEALSLEIGETCNFGVMAGNHVIYLDRVEAVWPFGLRFEPGSRVPLHCTSMGKLFLSFLPRQKRAGLVKAAPLYRYTDNTITDPALLDRELDKIRLAGVSADNQEFLAGVVCVAVPVSGPNGQPAAALAVSAPLARMSLDRALECVPLLRKAASHLAGTIEGAGERRRHVPRAKPEGRLGRNRDQRG